MKILSCVDCQTESECTWCECCTRPLCDECDPVHDCVSEHLDDDEDPDCPPDDYVDEEDDDSACGSA